jgi:hypothetical protein
MLRCQEGSSAWLWNNQKGYVVPVLAGVADLEFGSANGGSKQNARAQKNSNHASWQDLKCH